MLVGFCGNDRLSRFRPCVSQCHFWPKKSTIGGKSQQLGRVAARFRGFRPYFPPWWKTCISPSRLLFGAGLPMQACMEAPPRAVSVGGVWSCRVSVDGRKRVVASRFSAIRHRFGLVSDCNNRTTTCLMFREPLTIHPPIPSESNFPVRFGWNHISSYAGAIT